MQKQQLGKVLGWIASGTVLLAVIAAVIFIALVVWRHTDTGEDTGHVNGRTYALSAWSVYVDLPKTLEKETGDISTGYFKDPSTNADAYYLVSQELKNAKFLCTQDKSFETNGAFLKIERSYNQPPSANIKAKQVGSYYYWVDNAPFQGQCYDSSLMEKYFGVDTSTVYESIRTQSKP